MLAPHRAHSDLRTASNAARFINRSLSAATSIQVRRTVLSPPSPPAVSLVRGGRVSSRPLTSTTKNKPTQYQWASPRYVLVDVVCRGVSIRWTRASVWRQTRRCVRRERGAGCGRAAVTRTALTPLSTQVRLLEQNGTVSSLRGQIGGLSAEVILCMISSRSSD